MMYIDSLWNYYNGGDFTLTDEQYDRLRDELNWQGSGFPTLRRYEVQFVEAAISYARGEAKVTDQEYEELKRKVRAAGKRDDVTALLLYTKGQQLLEPAQFEQLRDDVQKRKSAGHARDLTCQLLAGHGCDALGCDKAESADPSKRRGVSHRFVTA